MKASHKAERFWVLSNTFPRAYLSLGHSSRLVRLCLNSKLGPNLNHVATPLFCLSWHTPSAMCLGWTHIGQFDPHLTVVYHIRGRVSQI